MVVRLGLEAHDIVAVIASVVANMPLMANFGSLNSETGWFTD